MDIRVDESLIPEEERGRARQLIAQYQKLLKENPLLGYQPHPKQVTFHGAQDPVKAFLGGNRSGKTTAGILDDLIQACDRDVIPEHLQGFKRWEPPFFCRIVVPDLVSTLEGVVFQKLRDWTPKNQLTGGSWERAYSKQLRRLSFANGSWFDFLTFEMDVDKFGGAALHRVHYDEEPPRVIRQESLMRLIDYAGDELFTMTPLQGMSWMFDEIYDPWDRGLLENATVVLVDMDDNPHLDTDTKTRVLKGLSHEERQARKQGRFVHFAGLIYDEFSRHEHVIPQAPVPKDARVFVGIDPGMRHMAAVVWAYLDENDTLVQFDELALRRATVAEVAQAIHFHNASHKVKVDWYVIDPAARNIMHQTGRSDQMEYMDHGIVTIAGQNEVRPGINRVKERLQTNRYLVMANCEHTIDEFRRYRWKTPTRTEDDPKEAPVKKDDHLLDCVRYICMSRPQPPEARRQEFRGRPLEEAMEAEVSGKGWRRKKVPKTEFGGIFA